MSPTILTYPDERLRQKAAPVDVFDDALADMAEHLQQALGEGPAAVGIAAPQIGILQRLIIVDCRRSLRPCANHGRLFMANPEITQRKGERLGREGCLSVPDWVAMVPRAAEICVRYQDLHGEMHDIRTRGFEARVIQHELDHLDGILFIDRVVSSRDLVRRAGKQA